MKTNIPNYSEDLPVEINVYHNIAYIEVQYDNGWESTMIPLNETLQEISKLLPRDYMKYATEEMLIKYT